MRNAVALLGALGLLLAACASGARSSSTFEANGSRSCALLREATAQVDDVAAGVALSLRLSRPELDVITLQDYLRHIVTAWNEAERGIVQRCSPRVGRGTAAKVLASTVELTLLLDGARVVFKPVDPAQLASLREHVRRQRGHALSCACEQSLIPRPPNETLVPSRSEGGAHESDETTAVATVCGRLVRERVHRRSEKACTGADGGRMPRHARA